jgi:hypothetical protein
MDVEHPPKLLIRSTKNYQLKKNKKYKRFEKTTGHYTQIACHYNVYFGSKVLTAFVLMTTVARSYV